MNEALGVSSKCASFFPLSSDQFQFGLSIYKDVDEKIIGRSILEGHDAGALCQMAALSRHGDHIEIGSLFGGSAIIVALMKKEFRYHGNIVCVDPLDARPNVINDTAIDYMPSVELLMDNASMFGVADMIEICPKYSKPWPLGHRKFATGYIDGDHWNGNPMHDVKQLMDCVSLAIMLDDYCYGKPEVVDAAIYCASSPQWIPIHIWGRSFVLRKRH